MSKVGYSSNHGMTVSDAKMEIIKQEASLIRQNKGHVVTCPYCAEEYHFSKKEYEQGDQIRLKEYMNVHRCPWCEILEVNGKITYGWQRMLKLCMASGRMHPVTEHNFTLSNGFEIKAVRKPKGWKGVSKIVKEKK